MPNALEIVVRLGELHGLIPPDMEDIAEEQAQRRATLALLGESFMRHQSFIEAPAGTAGLRDAAQEVAEQTASLNEHIVMKDLRELQQAMRRKSDPSSPLFRQINGACAYCVLPT